MLYTFCFDSTKIYSVGALVQNLVSNEKKYFVKLTKLFNQKLYLARTNEFGQMNKNLVHSIKCSQEHDFVQ